MTKNQSLTDDPLAILQVIDRLEVGPIKLEKQRVIAPYRLIRAEADSVETELIYRFEEDVFDPDEVASQNLASMMVAQVALNYGLFCKEIVFHGVYDETDQRFLRDMAENTSREIYVKKFLEPNPFLIGDVANLPAIKQNRYTRATLVFPKAPVKTHWSLWPTHRIKHAILSSGGKDSLLTYGLLHEIGQEVHPISLNESGRHWFTALNPYRHFRDTVPNTARVWINSDRVFA